ncbi:MAG TPA: phosphatidylglycerol lysyltransferase domain-containing protein [Actinomycetes bacterium]
MSAEVEAVRGTVSEDRQWIPRTVGAVCLVIGVLDVVAAVTPRLSRRLHLLSDILPGTISDATVAALLVVGIGFMLLAGGLARRKRRAWQLSVALLAMSVVLHLLGAVTHPGLAAVSLGMLVALLANQREFYAVGDPYTRWSALRYLLFLLPFSLLVGMVLAYGFREALADREGFWKMLGYVFVGLFGLPTRLDQQPGVRADIVYYALLALGLVTFGTALFLLLRSPRPLPLLTASDQERMRELLAREGERDSLGYFALRRDKSVVWSPTGKACVAYRVTSGVMLASGDPIGDPEAWPGAIEMFVQEAKRHAWIPAVVACSEIGAEIWVREAGLDALEIGDEAIVEVEEFSLEGRSMRNVRQMVNRVSRAGYACELRRMRDIPAAELDELRRCVSAWRVGEVERGFSMALGRFGDPADDCVVVTARQGGKVRALLAFVPWGEHGLSLDLMRRDRESEAGVNELLIVETLTRAHELGIQRVSLNFAVFRGSLARGERIGASPGTRAWRRLLIFASRWAQIESLYRFNAKFQPAWEPRFVLYPDVGDLPRVAVAYLEAEAFITYPRLVFWRARDRRAVRALSRAG